MPRRDDIKKILAYSTVSQLGYMFLAAGVGAYIVIMIGIGIWSASKTHSLVEFAVAGRNLPLWLALGMLSGGRHSGSFGNFSSGSGGFGGGGFGGFGGGGGGSFGGGGAGGSW